MILTSPTSTLTGYIFDLSMNGVGLIVDQPLHDEVYASNSWQCCIESTDIPGRIEVTTMLARHESLDNSTLIGCEIMLVNEASYRLLKQFRTQAQSRVSH